MKQHLLFTFLVWIVAVCLSQANVLTSPGVDVPHKITYTLQAPVDVGWSKNEFDDSAWTKATSIGEVAKAVAPAQNVWIRIQATLPWELIDNTYVRLTRNETLQMFVNGKEMPVLLRGLGKIALPISPVRPDKPGLNTYGFHVAGNQEGPTVDVTLVHEPWVDVTVPPNQAQPLIDEKLRDANVILGGDGQYYMTGTFAGTFGDGLLFFDYKGDKKWKNNDGIKLYKSPDLKHWTDLGWVWTFKNNATWCKEPGKDGKQGIFAPTINYINGKYVLLYGLNWSSGKGGDTGIAIADRPEGPYHETSPDKPISKGIDSQLLRDDDGQIYLVNGRGLTARLKPDLSGLLDTPRMPDLDNYPIIGYEGAGILKRNGLYYLMGADNLVSKNGVGRWGPTMVATSKNIYGPYGKRYVLMYQSDGHTRPFQDKEGNWWTANFDNDDHHLAERFTITGISFDADGAIRANGKSITKD